MWIESHQELKDHPKTEHLAVLLGVPKVQVIGHLHCLWWWAVDYARDGYINRYPAAVVARGALWDGDPDKFISALMEARWVDADGKLHDWEEYAGRLIEQRERAKERYRRWKAKRDVRAKSEQKTRSQRVANAQLRGKNEVTIPNQPNQPNRISPPPGDPPPHESARKGRKRREPRDVALEALHEASKRDREAALQRLVTYYLQRHPRPDADKEELTDITSKARSEISALLAANVSEEAIREAIDAAPVAAMPWHITQTYRQMHSGHMPRAEPPSVADGGPLPRMRNRQAQG